MTRMYDHAWVTRRVCLALHVPIAAEMFGQRFGFEFLVLSSSDCFAYVGFASPNGGTDYNTARTIGHAQFKSVHKRLASPPFTRTIISLASLFGSSSISLQLEA
jgi:hypothetical protein